MLTILKRRLPGWRPRCRPGRDHAKSVPCLNRPRHRQRRP
jgi:hypothetical protein